jgi:uncharacterized delta-60 repeat protein
MSLFAIITASWVGCQSKDEAPAPEPENEPEMDAAMPDASEPEQPEATGSFILTLATEKLPILQGTSEKLVVKIERKNGFDEAIEISASGLPEGVSVAAVRAAADASEATLVFEAAKTAPHSLPTAAMVKGVAKSASEQKPLTVTVYGPPGSLDTSFAGGKVVVPAGAADDYAHAVAVDAKGRIIVAGQSAENSTDFALLRLTRDGERDGSFGKDGVVTTQVGKNADIAYAVAVQADGKILVAGNSIGASTGLDFALVRYEEDGSLDESFGDKGIATTSFGADSDTAYALLIQADGKIVLGGESRQNASGIDFALARFNPNGSLDESFGDAGKVLTAVSAAGARDTIYALALMEVGGEQMILAAGGEGDFKAARYHADGTLDAGFGSAGLVQSMFGSSIGTARAIGTTEAGEIVIAGHSNHDFALVRLSAAGVLDAKFGDKGKVTTALSKDNWDEVNGMVLEDGGKIVVGGWVYEGSSSNGNFAVVRYTADGALDASFGEGGEVVTEVSAPQRRDEAAAVLLQTDERVPTVRVLLAGSATGAGNSDFAVTRYWR